MEVSLALLYPLAWVLAAASLILAATLGIILAFHWFRYAMNPFVSGMALAIYVVVSATLLAGMFATLVALSISL